MHTAAGRVGAREELIQTANFSIATHYHVIQRSRCRPAIEIAKGITLTHAVHSFDLPGRSASGVASLIAHVADTLRNAIIHGELHPGQKLVEADLSRSLGVSRASLREALRVLETEKLIAIVPNRGPSVAKVAHHDIEAIHDVWALLVGDAVAAFARDASERDIAALERQLASLNDAIAANAPLDQLAATNRFLAVIVEKHGNDVLAEVVTTLVSRINFLRSQALLRQGWGVVHAREIEDILAAIKARNPEAAREETRKHIASACTAAKHLALGPELVSSITLPRRESWERDLGDNPQATAA